ncbi:50S ribosomal protein L16, partial [Candidatus Woesearchaeota archaeon]|nr:50S ribosomal protein L16 [Candidatus Woesearchaeota archaeon]
MGLRPAHCYREIERSYTRHSKYKAKGYVKSMPPIKITKFDFGNTTKNFESRVDIFPKADIQIRHNSLESARMLANRRLHKSLGANYRLKVRVYPHHVLREHKMLTGAGADRMSPGMSQAFGKPIGLAAQVKAKQPIISVFVEKKDVKTVINVLDHTKARLPGKCGVSV